MSHFCGYNDASDSLMPLSWWGFSLLEVIPRHSFQMLQGNSINRRHLPHTRTTKQTRIKVNIEKAIIKTTTMCYRPPDVLQGRHTVAPNKET